MMTTTIGGARCGDCEYIRCPDVAGDPERYLCGYPLPKWITPMRIGLDDDADDCPCFECHD